MKRHHHKAKYVATPQKPELEITSTSDIEDDETVALSSLEDSDSDIEGTSIGSIGNNTLTVPMHIPEREKLALNMVPRELIYQYEEYRSDESNMAAFFYTILGAFFGVLINWATSDPIVISKTSIIIELILLVFIIVIGLFTYRFNRRAKNKKSEIDNLAK